MDELELLAEELGVSDFDLMLVGDGSGQTAETPCGFACYSYDRLRNEVVVHSGGLSHGTNNFVELIPYVHALWHYETVRRRGIQKKIKVLVVSDSELTVRQGEGRYTRNANRSLWASIDYFVQNGYEVTWKHVRRNTNQFSKSCDGIAGKIRLTIANEITKI